MARKRRTFTSEFKAKIVLQLISGEKSLAEICREYKLNQQMVSRWKTEFLQNAPSIFERKKKYSAERQRIAELEQVLGRKTMELEIAKKAYSILEQMDAENER
jgi:transposase-like protein